MTENRWIKTKQGVADYFHVSLSTVKNWDRILPLPFVRLGRIVIARESDLDAWAAKFANLCRKRKKVKT